MKRSFKKAVAFSIIIFLLTGCLSEIPTRAEEKGKAKKTEDSYSSALIVPAEYEDVAVWDYGALLREEGELYYNREEGYKDYILDTEGNITKLELPESVISEGQKDISIGLATRKTASYSELSPEYYQILSLKYDIMVQKGNSYGFYNNQGKLMNNTFYENITPAQAGYILTEGTNTKVLDRDGKVVGTYPKKDSITDIVDSGKFEVIYKGFNNNKVADLIDQNGRQVLPDETILNLDIISVQDKGLLHCINSQNLKTKVKTISLYLDGKKIASGENWIIETKDLKEWNFSKKPIKYYDSKKKKYGLLTLEGKLTEAIYDEIFYSTGISYFIDDDFRNSYSAIVRIENTIYELFFKQDKVIENRSMKVSDETLEKLRQDKSATTIDKTKYNSEVYGFKVKLPEDYIIYDEEITMNIIYQSMSTLYKNVDAMLSDFESKGIKYPFVAITSNPVSKNANANIIVQLCPSSVLSGTLEDVVRKSLESSIQQYKDLGITPIINKPKLLSVDGKDIYIADSSVYIDGDFGGVTYKDFTLYQKYICFDSGVNRILMNCTYYNEEEGKAIDTMINSIRIIEWDWEKIFAQVKLYELQSSSKKLPYSKINSIDNFRNIVVNRQDLYGIISTNGEELLPVEYDNIKEGNFGYITKKGEKYGFSSNIGKQILECKYSSIKEWKESTNKITLIVSNQKDKYGLIDCQEGKELIPFIYDNITPLIGNFYLVQNNGKSGIMNSNGTIVIPLGYENIYPMVYGESSKEKSFCISETQYFYEEDTDIVFLVKDKKGNFGVYSKGGKILIPVQYSYVKRNLDGSFLVKNNKYGLFTSLGVQCLSTSYHYISDPVDDTVMTIDNDFYSIYGLDGTLYKKIKGYQPVSKEYYNYYEEINLQPVVDENIIFITNSDNKEGILDRQGGEICDFIYNSINYCNGWRNWNYRYLLGINHNYIKINTESPTKLKAYILEQKQENRTNSKLGLIVYFQLVKEELEPTTTPTSKPTVTLEPTPMSEITEETETGERIHIVIKGDTMGSITAKYYGNNANRTALYNYNKDAFEKTNGKLVIGMKLRIPDRLNGQNRLPIPVLSQGENLYIVKLGDTLSKLAREFYHNTFKYKIIYERNKDRIKNPNMIYVGQEIVIPKE